MTRRSARFLTRLYPPHWRARYGREFQTFLESRRVRPIEVLTTIAAALSERLSGSLTTLLYTPLATIAVGGALYKAMSGVPLAQIVQTHRALCLLWAMIEACSLAMVAVGAVTFTPVAFSILRRPGVLARKGVRWSLAIPAAFVFLLALGRAVGASAGTTLIVLAALMDHIAGLLKYLTARSKFSRSLGRVKLGVLALARSIVSMTLVATGLGFSRHSVWGGMPHTFWSLVLTVIAAGAFSSVRSARRLDLRRME